ncbi:MAG: NAD(P)H-hydrate dehydratase [Candidatus Micrarchaeota archaeon]
MPKTSFCSEKDWLAIKKPHPKSHKGQNGRLLIFAGSPLYHGALILAIKAAVRFCDLVYVYTNNENHPLVEKLKGATPNIILLNPRTISQFFTKIDAYLAGPGWEKNEQNKQLLSKLVETKKPLLIDASALFLLNLSLIHKNVLLTPHHAEFQSLFSLPPTPANAKKITKKYRCTILLKGPIDYISSPSYFKANNIHHVGMTKGGTGDVLAGLASALLSSGNSPYRAACAAAFLNGYAGVLLSKTKSAHYSSEDLAEMLASAANEIEKSSKKIKE